MKGRDENRIKREKQIKKNLENMPKVVKDYYQNLKSRGLESKTCLEYISNLRRFLLFLNEDMSKINIKEITDGDISRYINEAQNEISPDASVATKSYSYKKAIYHSLNSFFNYLSKTRRIEYNPMDVIDMPRGYKEKERPNITAEDELNILNQVNLGAGSEHAKAYQQKWKERDYLILLLFIYTGMRKTALSEINLRDIDKKSGVLNVTDKRNSHLVYSINDDNIQAALNAWLKKRKVILGEKKCDALFISSQKQRMSSQSVANIVKKYAGAAKGEKVTPHDLRAAFITLAYNNTGDIEKVRRMVKHKSVSTTQRYIHKNDKIKEEAVELVSSYLNIRK